MPNPEEIVESEILEKLKKSPLKLFKESLKESKDIYHGAEIPTTSLSADPIKIESEPTLDELMQRNLNK